MIRIYGFLIIIRLRTFLQMCIFIECKWIDKRKEVIIDRNLIIKMCSFSICIMCLYYIYILYANTYFALLLLFYILL